MAYRVYLVGGAVRDTLLGFEPRENDWVVVGGRPEDLLDRGFRQVGASFPVFLHPESGEEYALARRERKEGHGYHGFAVDFAPDVTLEEDLLRRDLTINAMARDEHGRIIDPLGGRDDLERRVLRHVSPAFREDPLRVLRVARFAARLAPLGFTVHPSTMELMRDISASGELEHLAAERSWAEVEGAMASARPGVFIEVLRACGALQRLLPEVDVLFGVPQPEKYHPEIDTGLHVQMAMDFAAERGWGPEVVFSLLLHDLGKGITPSEEWPSHLRHEQRGVPLARRVCERLKAPNRYRRLALMVTALHLRCHRLTEMKPATKLKLIEEADLLRRPDLLDDFVRACEADYRGRGGFRDRSYPQAGILAEALRAALSVRARDLDTTGLNGTQVGNLLREARVRAIAGT
ncbi:MAG: multifunctional CCA addition/repair protein [Xanthomonadales bacterium]|jgi:tRNA nucleotidyltransferase (CCA-adding enzyme)|nr:multifunctional CCA addition/repair protein [Xanthomonadales bacterium]